MNQENQAYLDVLGDVMFRSYVAQRELMTPEQLKKINFADDEIIDLFEAKYQEMGK